MRFLVTFVAGGSLEGEGEAQEILDVCVVAADTREGALSAARTICRQGGRAHVLTLSDVLKIEPVSLHRRLARAEAADLCDTLARQLIHARAKL